MAVKALCVALLVAAGVLVPVSRPGQRTGW